MAITLEKRVETVKINLKKKSAKESPRCDVAIALDVSGSMADYYRSGVVQDVVDRVFAMAFNMDPNKELEVFAFDTGVKQCPSMTESDYGSYVGKYVSKHVGGGTKYSPLFEQVREFYSTKTTVDTSTIIEKAAKGIMGFFGKKVQETVTSTQEVLSPSSKPVYLIFITDGEASDDTRTIRAIEAMGAGNVYIQCVGIGSRFTLLERIADKYDHVGFCKMNNLNMSDDEMFDLFITDEFVAFVNKFGA